MGMTLEQATALVKTNVAWDQDPALSAQEIADLMARHARAVAWSASTARAYGDRLVPSVRNGRYYVCTKAGVSGAAEPTWPIADGASVTDGTATFTEAGADWADLWDVRAASHEGWLIKAGKAASRYDFKDKGQGFERSQLQEHCERMAARYQPLRLV